ncbi:uncharacterized protein LOC106093152 [Stomoxys calcitrans]|uniref:N-acetyltransferase domain-containing protein n=1 Tax=Stomoxys calcitrans TaxID=35570 RepID=A0A1I8PR21_STOCA|nr:uncharacterized protein LOC106093152 [Stomoxys calcitrans]
MSNGITKPEILRPLTEPELEELLQLYKQKYGIDSPQYLLIYNQCKWNEKLKELKISDQNKKWISFRREFYTHAKGDFRTYGTYICLHQDLIQSVTFHTWQPDFKELLECLDKTELICWQSGPLLVNVAAEYSKELRQIIANKGVTIQRARSSSLFVLKRENALNLDPPVIPDGYELRQLQQEDAELVHSHWPNKKEGSLDYLKGLIEIDTTFGVFKKADNSLIAWIFRNEFSGLGILQVLESEQRKGFGTIVVKAISYAIAKTESINITAWILLENVKSQTLFRNIGFEARLVNQWIQLNKIE